MRAALMDHLFHRPLPGRDTSSRNARARPGRDFGRVHQDIDVEPVTLVGRHSPGRRVRLLEVAELLKISHLVTDCRRAYTEIVLAGDCREPTGSAVSM